MVTIKDNGQGFTVPGTVGDLTRDGKLGLTGMHERARLVGGSVTLQSAPGKGTTIVVDVPV
jgi:signal transduction histidine kinase